MMAWSNMTEILNEVRPPVVTALYRAEKIDANTVQVQMYITRKQDCDFVRATAFTGQNTTDMRAATARRADGSDPISYPVGITVLSHPWHITPINGPLVQMYGYYDCNDRLVKVRLVNEVIR
jgi:hypothetical protein